MCFAILPLLLGVGGVASATSGVSGLIPSRGAKELSVEMGGVGWEFKVFLPRGLCCTVDLVGGAAIVVIKPCDVAEESVFGRLNPCVTAV